MKLRGTTRKYIFRQAVKDLVPAAILSGKKRGFGIPLQHWLRQDLRSMARDSLLGPASRTIGFFRHKDVEPLLDSHDREGRDLSEGIRALLVLEEWFRRVDS